MKKRINVSYSDIYFGLRGCTNKCPIARAVSNELDIYDVSVRHKAIYARDSNDRSVCYRLPAKAQRFIWWFDNSQSNMFMWMLSGFFVRPFSFEIYIDE